MRNPVFFARNFYVVAEVKFCIFQMNIKDRQRLNDLRVVSKLVIESKLERWSPAPLSTLGTSFCSWLAHLRQ